MLLNKSFTVFLFQVLATFNSAQLRDLYYNQGKNAFIKGYNNGSIQHCWLDILGFLFPVKQLEKRRHWIATNTEEKEDYVWNPEDFLGDPYQFLLIS